MDERARKHEISEDAARKLESRYQVSGVIQYWRFPVQVYEELQAHPMCHHIQTSCGMTDAGELQLILRAVDKKGDVIPEATVFEEAVPCPPWCK